MGWFLSPYLISHLFLLLLLLHLPSYTCSSLCNYHDSSALLHFKNSFLVNTTADDHTFPFKYQFHDGSSYIYTSPCSSAFPSKTESWKNGTDCCNWDGVTCNVVSGYVIGLDLSCGHLRGEFHPNSTLFQLRHLQKLNLAFNHFSVSPLLYSGIGDLFQLTHLNLSNSEIRGDIPSTISHLSKLVSLDLSYLPMRLDPSTWNKLILNTSNLRELHLGGVNMYSISASSLLVLTNLSSSLVYLYLQGTKLQGNLPTDILCLPNLEELDLSSNDELRGQLPKSNWSTPLSYLDLSYTSFSGEIPNTIGHLKHLQELYLSYCKFNGLIHLSLWNLTQLTDLILSSNNLTGLIPSKIPTSSKLSYLDLGYNMLNGTIPHWCFSLPSLLSLDLGDNQLTGSIGEFSTSSLEYLDLSNNNLQGKFPYSIFELENLSNLDLSSNGLRGTVDFHQFSKLKSLTSLDLSNLDLSSNGLRGTVDFHQFSKLKSLTSLDLSNLDLSSNGLRGTVDFHQFSKLKSLTSLDLSNTSFLSVNSTVDCVSPNLEYLYLSSCGINGSFPKFTKLQNLQVLDLSNNNIHGKIPKWFHEKLLHSWNNIYQIDLSFNKLQGDLPILPYGTKYFLASHNNFTGDIDSTICNASSLKVLNLDHNNLKSTIPQCICNSSSLSILNLAHNNLTGTIPQGLCNASSLYFLNLAHNNLKGTIPSCLGTFPYLTVLDLQMNNLHGSMPGNFSKRNVFETIKLNGNKLEGPLPQSLAYCENLEVLDLGDNNIEDSFPSWLETLQELQVLSLRSNKLRGIITCSTTKHPFPKLRIFDVSNNNFSGFLPTSCFANFQGMMNVDDNQNSSLYMGGKRYYNDSVVVTMKGQEMELTRILTAFTTIDFSNNMFEGDIPKVIGRLKSLIGLNLSYNGINDTIPQSLSNLRNLEWMDLSWNRLTGEIPLALTNLSFLSMLNLSQNHLEGIIPTGGQFDTFGNASYGGNLMLCGLPLSKSCNIEEEKPPHSTFKDDEESGFGWKSVAVGYACGAVFGMLLGYNLFLTEKPQWLARLVEGLFGIRVKRTNNRARANCRGIN